MNVALLCGGTGGASVVRGLPPELVMRTAIVNTSDDGGDTRRMLMEGLIDMPPGDARNLILAMSMNEALRTLHDRRNALGHSPGNMRIAELNAKYGSFRIALKMFGLEHNIDGLVLPVTTVPHVLTMQDGNEYLEGEYQIGHRAFNTPFPTLGQRSHSGEPVTLDSEAEAALLGADLILIAPGNPQGSIRPALIVEGVRETVQASSAPVVMFGNLLESKGQSTGGHVMDHFRLIESDLGKGAISGFIYNKNLPDRDFLRAHAAPDQQPLRIDAAGFRGAPTDLELFPAELLAQNAAVRDENDTLKSRSMIRNDSTESGRQALHAAGVLGVKMATIAA